ncbi:MAG: ABC transporter substrate-binding protein [Polyangiales bacterium]
MRRLALVAVLLALFGCKKSAPAEGGKSKLKVQLNWVPEPEFGGIYAARSSGAYGKQNLEIEIIGGGPSVPVLQVVASGQMDFGVVGADDVVLARARGVDVVAVFATFQHSPLGVMVHAQRGIEKLEDLKSGTLAIEPGLPFAQWLKKKYTFAGVTIVPYDGGVAKFLSDPQYAQQCYVTSEPIAAKQKGVSTKVFSARETGFDPYTNVLIVRGETLKTKLSLVKSFVAATREGWKTYLADPKPANDEMGKLNPAMDAATFAEASKAQDPLVQAPELGAMTADRWQTIASQLVELGTVQKAVPANECFSSL